MGRASAPLFTILNCPVARCQAMHGFEVEGHGSRFGVARQAGLSLVELLVSLVIGLVVALGAGQLYLSGFLNFRQVQLLGDKQSALMFAAETLVRDIRRANDVDKAMVGGMAKLRVRVDNRGDLSSAGCPPGDEVTKDYWVEEDGGENVLKVSTSCGAVGPFSEPIVSGFSSGGFSFSQDASVNAVWVLNFELLSSVETPGLSDSYEFRAVNRTLAIQAFGS